MGKKKNRRKNKKNESQLCGACVLISILAGDLSFVKASFYKTFSEKTEWFWHIRNLNASGIEMIADDISQTVYTVLWAMFKSDSLKDIINIMGFIKIVTRNQAIREDKGLGRSVDVRIDDTAIDGGCNQVLSDKMITSETGESAHYRKEVQALVRKEIMKLSPSKRFLLYCRYNLGLSGKEISEITGKSVNCVESTLSQSRKQLKKILEHLVADLIY
jgi:RNA polymerase sigma factor (sigma-70 family)